MNRWEFMQELEYLLRNIPKNDRNDALAYYHNYFDEAGAEHEQDVIRELGSPKNVAEMILADYEGVDILQDYSAPKVEQSPIVYEMKQEDKNRQRYHDTDDIDKNESRNYQKDGFYQEENCYENQNWYEKNVSQTGNIKEKMSTSKIVLIVIIAILTFPIWIGIVAGLFGAIIGVLGGLFGVLVGLGGASIGMVIGSIICIGAGVLRVFTIPAEGFAMIGVGALLMSLSILWILLFAWMMFRWIPALVKPVINWGKGLFQRMKGGCKA